jgi:hypothetical protein
LYNVTTALLVAITFGAPANAAFATAIQQFVTRIESLGARGRFDDSESNDVDE